MAAVHSTGGRAAENRVALKGHDFSRAAKTPIGRAALAAEGMRVLKDTFPQGLKPIRFYSAAGGTAKAVPFQSAAVLVALCALALLTGCKPVGPNYSRPGYQAPALYKETGASSVIVPPPNPAGGAWTAANPSDGMLKGKWWEIYGDHELDALEDRIDTTNVQLRQALETYLAARDEVSAARANLYPTLAAGPSITHEKTSANRPLSSSASPTSYNDLVLEGEASWEPDFWGRIRRSVEAAHATAQASAAEMANVSLSLHAEMASDYFSLRGLDAQAQLLKDTVADLEGQLNLTERLFKGGLDTQAAVAEAQTQLETVRAQLVDVGVARAEFEHAIGTIANYDISTFGIPPAPLEGPLPKVPLGVPSQLLERRPDIAAAERQADAANAQIGIAVSAFYPTITLGATGGFESTNPGTWIQGPSSLWSLGAQATELLFDAGQRHALTDQARHTYEAQADAYRNTVFSAFQDVEDQLSTLRILEAEAGVEQQAVAAAQNSFNISDASYKGGVTSYLQVLTAETALLQNQSTAIGIESRRFVASVGLVRALGGGWDATQLPK
ncbi:MAG: efflux transporter outer membrane subunit [Terracidiphilus sp.]